MRPLSRAALAACLALLPSSSFAWSHNEHSAVAAAAWNLLQQHNSPAVSAIQQLLPAGASLSSIAPCADDIRHPPKSAPPTVSCGGLTLSWNPASADWHFVDESVTDSPSSPADLMSSCPNGACNFGAVSRQINILHGDAAGDKLTALMFVVHLVGDAHQPLHCATEYVLDSNGQRQPDPKRPGKWLSDGGGNGKPVTIPGTSPKYPLELHSLWDMDLEAADGTPSITGLTWQGLDPGQTPDQLIAGAAFDSFKIAKTVIYPDFYDANVMPVASDGTTRVVTPDYQSRMKQMAALQMQLAATRLAAILDYAFSQQQTGSAPAAPLPAGSAPPPVAPPNFQQR